MNIRNTFSLCGCPHDDAEIVYNRALSISERSPGHRKLDLAASFSSLAGVYGAQGKYDKAEDEMFNQYLIPQSLQTLEDLENIDLDLTDDYTKPIK